MEMMLSSNEELFAFKKRVGESIKGWPFYYKLAKTDEKYVKKGNIMAFLKKNTHFRVHYILHSCMTRSISMLLL